MANAPAARASSNDLAQAVSALDHLLERIEAAAQASEFAHMETLLGRLSRVLESTLPASRTESVLIKLQQVLQVARANRTRMHHELKTLERCSSYLDSRNRGSGKVVLTA